jgi:hypothetical protein
VDYKGFPVFGSWPPDASLSRANAAPANVKRRSVAMQAISVMMDRDIYKSYLRSEAIMSVLLETKLIPEQDAVSNEVGQLSAQVP